jgi:2-polyprenyl-6-methoxyphenol hydroxylase-like FAD-dependent oxidoreductase
MPGNKLAWNMVSFESNKFLHQTGNRKRKLTNYLKNWKTELSSIILETDEESIIKSGAFLRPALKNWVPERIFLGGDANLLLSPLLGLGANFAFQEAVELAETIKKLGLNQFAFDEFEKWRNTKGTILQDISKRYVTVSQMSTLVALFAGNSTIVNRIRRVLTEAALGQD